jgi:hypothetical protein
MAIASTCGLSVLRQFKVWKTLDLPLAVMLGFNPRFDSTLTRVLPSMLEDLKIGDTMCDWRGYE